MNRTLGSTSFTAGQLRQFLFILEQLPAEIQDGRAVVASKGESYWEALTPPYYWSEAYELSFIELLGLVVLVGDISVPPLQQEDPADRFQSFIDSALADTEEDWEGGVGGQFELRHLMGASYAVAKSIESLSVFDRSLNALIADVKNGSDEALLKVIRIDRSALSNPTIADRLARAEFEQDEDFFKKLRNALSGGYKKHRPEYQKLRYTLAVLQELGLLEQLSVEERYELLCLELGLYPDEGKDPAGSLDRFISRWKDDFQT